MLKTSLKVALIIIVLSLPGCTALGRSKDNVEYRRLPVKEYRDKLKAGWLGQIVAVSWAAPTEFKWKDKIIPLEDMPAWRNKLINEAFNQDDLYVEMTFLRSLEEYGIDVSIRQAGIDFANTEYPLWCANETGRRNLRMGIAPPDCSHPAFSNNPHDIDYQIEADYSGLIAPGMFNVPIALGDKFGRLMNYSDGVYAGQFVGGMYSEAFFEDDIIKIIEAGLACIPQGCQYAEMVRDVVSWYKANPDNWEATWKLCQEKYRRNPEYQKNSNGGIDVKINGAYILIGMLYGEKDIDQTIIIATRCGQDSDCNPSNAAGVLFTSMGTANLPDRFKENLDQETYFSHTPYNFPKLLEVCEKLAREFVVKEGGRVETDSNGEEVFVIPVKRPTPSPLVFSWDPEPITNSLFTKEEMEQIKHLAMANIQGDVDKRFPGWTIAYCGSEMQPGLRDAYKGKNELLLTHPLSKDMPCVLTKVADISKGKKTVLKTQVSHHNGGDWILVIRVNGSVQKEVTIGKETVDENGWLDVEFDLTPFAGNKNVKIDLENKANGWRWEAAYWSDISIESL